MGITLAVVGVVDVVGVGSLSDPHSLFAMHVALVSLSTILLLLLLLSLWHY